MKRLLSGIKPTGELHIGHYIGAIKHFIEMQKDYESFVFVADLHSLTINPDPKELRNNIKEMLGLYLACGLDPKHTTIFNQSENIYHPALSWALTCHSYMGELNRMTQYKDKSLGQKNESINSGLFTYPVLMAADILIYDADVVPVGDDQKQHVELTRTLAERFNNRYGTTFKVPIPVIAKQGARIMDLQDPTKKMSKTDDNQKGVINLLDDLVVARKKIMSAVTDSDNIIKYDIINKPGISNLITIYSCLTNKDIKTIEEEFKNSNYGEFKTKVANEVIKLLEYIQNKYNEIIKTDYIDNILDKGLKKVEEISKNKMLEVYKKLGLGRY
ncbi:MAG: tryptophan--tRNA ligase [Bacilli bacterium]|nr:tryptophan--tRNA ligase [Bacilli bacterium]MDD4795291.1 tryptophan--tRNA ligase [Bacilli bacterium]